VAITIVMVTISTRREVAIASSPDDASSPDQEPRPQIGAGDAVEVPIEQTETKVDKLAK
jgi:hypothetical protein